MSGEGDFTICRHCDDELPDDCLPHVTSCRGYCDWRAREEGDLLPADETDALALFTGLCEVDLALREGHPHS